MTIVRSLDDCSWSRRPGLDDLVGSTPMARCHYLRASTAALFVPRRQLLRLADVFVDATAYSAEHFVRMMEVRNN